MAKKQKHTFMKKLLILILPLSVATYLLAYQIESSDLQSLPGDSTSLSADLRHEKVDMLVTSILSNYHYSKKDLNDELSSNIYDQYIKSLDNNRVYFLAEDINKFENYRYKLDDYLKSGELDHIYEMFNRFKVEFNRRNKKVNEILQQDFDFSKEEYYQSDREDAAWATSEEELDEIWRKIIKDQALSLKLTGKEMSEIRDILKKRYDNLYKNMSQVNSEDVFQIYMNSFATVFDPHTAYFSPRTSENFHISMSQSLEGIGARLQMENDYVKVAEVIAGGPAFKSKKISEGDLIVGVAQGKEEEIVDVVGWRLDDVVALIRGPKSTTVRLSVLPAETGVNGLPEEIILVRDKIKLEDQKATSKIYNWNKEDKSFKLGVITIPSFYMDFEAMQKGNKDYNSTTRDVKRLINEMSEKEKIDGLIIDLRMNGGGSLTEAIELTGLFIEDGPVVQVRNSNGNVDIAEDPDPSIVYNGPLAVMVNRFSASASEIFAGAIQDYKRGLVLGEQTFGKGTVQNLMNLDKYMPGSDEKLGELKITLAKFYRVNGSSTQHKGVNPDIAFPSAFSAEEFGESSQDFALPWDQIKSTDYQQFNYITPDLLETLSKNYKFRLNNDPEMKKLIQEINDLTEDRKQTLLSLNEKERKAAREAAEERKDARMALTGTIHSEIHEKDNTEEIEDAYLRESLNLTADMIVIMNS
jgi:carboxyl-terminal processing protease